jgi:hypothetical protein
MANRQYSVVVTDKVRKIILRLPAIIASKIEKLYGFGNRTPATWLQEIKRAQRV